MKILYIITGLGLGGAERIVVNLADQMAKRGHSVKICYLTGEAIVKPVSNDIELISLNLQSLLDFFSASRKYRKLIKQFNPDVVHANMVHANIFARLNRLFLKIPKLISTAHSSNEGGKLRMLGYQVTDFLSDINTNVSQEATESFIHKKAFKKNKSQSVYNGIDLCKFHKSVNKTKSIIKFLSVGRLTDPKDYPNLLTAISMVIKQNRNVHFQIVGDGELRTELERQIQALQLADFITLLGVRHDIPELMNEANFFILSSKYEGFGLVVAEAMACETFVIATDCGGVKEVMGGTGFLIEPENAVVLSEAILAAIELSQDKIDENNQKALLHVRNNFDLEKIADEWEILYGKN